MIAMYFFASLTFFVAGLSLSLFTQTIGVIANWAPGILPHAEFEYVHPYLDLGLRLFGFGLFLVAATFYQSLVRQKKQEPFRS